MPSLEKSEDLTTLGQYSHAVNSNHACALPFTVIARFPRCLTPSLLYQAPVGI